ncbi:iron-containing redox enzyme family protein [Nonomuraea sp. NPDC050783]|uniref:iron-containing redox enzyme family protein n=1 Tax=Nonomuraea sp. NPDC050783 TaxID=3154634 RepID=UPI003464F32F
MTVDHARLPGDELCAHRVLYVRASDPEEILLSDALIDDLARAIHGREHVGGPPADPGAELDHILRRAGEWADAEGERYRLVAESPRFADARSSIAGRIALNSAPMALISGAWLQWLVSSGNGDSELSTLVLGMYATDVGVGHSRSDRGSRYAELLQDLGLASRAVPESRLAAEPQTLDRAFELPGVLLAMSRCGEEFLPELLGADVCLRWLGLLPPLGFLRDSLRVEARWDSIDLGRQTRDTSLAIARAFVAADGGEAARLLHGARWALARVQEWSAELRADVENALDPAFEMAEMLRLRARQAAAYHDDFLLDGKPLREWFVDARDGGAEGFMAALAASRLVKPGQPDGSRLLGGLVDATGPMFRIFSPDDVSVIRRWIASLGEGDGWSAGSPPEDGRSTKPEAGGGEPGGAEVSRTAPPAPAGRRRGAVAGEAPATIRLAYHRLLRRGDSPELRRYALTYVSDWLDRSRAGIERVRKPPRTWQPGSLRKWLLDQHDEHDELFQASGDLEAPARDLVIDTYVQMAPLNLIDGSWLSGFTDYRQASSDFGHFLFATYWDELGNGERRLNHPLIYRGLMREMGFDLPPTASLEFADWPGFRDESFELPVYWLSINRFPRRFLPETLGLNLAMELSGVGGTYRRERSNLRAHGFSSQYFDIHNTIDNVATGHSAWAADAIEVYLAELSSRLGTEAAEKSWERIRVGFRSLHPPVTRPPAGDGRVVSGTP